MEWGATSTRLPACARLFRRGRLGIAGLGEDTPRNLRVVHVHLTPVRLEEDGFAGAGQRIRRHIRDGWRLSGDWGLRIARSPHEILQRWTRTNAPTRPLRRGGVGAPAQ